MSKITSTVIALIFSCCLTAQTSADEQALKRTIAIFFDGFHKGDASVMQPTLHADIKIQTTGTNNKGEAFLKTETREQLLKAIGSKPANMVYLEKLLSYTIKVDGNLASVWTPYEFYVNGTFSHCGANSFQLFKNKGIWEIIFLVDTRRRDGCQALSNKK